MSDQVGARPSEDWRPVVGYEGRYEVSSLGRVRSLFGEQPRLLAPDLFKDGYLRIALNRDGKRTSFLLHRVVALAFHPGGRNVLHNEVAHLDGIRTNAAAANLKWVSRVENHSHKRLHGTHQAGDNAGNRTLTSQQVAAIRLSKGVSTASQLGQQHGVSRHTIYDIWQGKKWVNG